MYGSMPPSLMQGPFANPVPLAKTKSPFLATLNFLDLTHLSNDPIYHKPRWPVILIKFPFNMPKFYKKLGEYPLTHVMTYHLWFSSNSLNGDSI